MRPNKSLHGEQEQGPILPSTLDMEKRDFSIKTPGYLTVRRDYTEGSSILVRPMTNCLLIINLIS